MPDITLPWDDDRHSEPLTRLYKQLHCAAHLPRLSAVDCVALAALSLAKQVQSFPEATLLEYIDLYIFNRDDTLAHIKGGTRFETEVLRQLIGPVIEALRAPSPLEAIDWMNEQ